MEFETREEINFDLVNVLTKFKWKIVKKDEVSYNRSSSLYGTKTVYTLSRSKAIMNYTKISELENEYFRLSDSIKKPLKLFKPTLIFLLLLGIIPGLFYLYRFNKNNKNIVKNNENANARMKKILEEVYML